MTVPPVPSVEASGATSGAGPEAPDEKHMVRTFGSEMIRAFCDDTGLRYATDSDGDVVISFGYGQARDCALRVYAYASGRSNSILCVRVVSDKRYRPEHEPALLEVINRFHCDRRWPKVYSRAADNTVNLVCESQLDLAMGAHQAFVNDFIDTAISSANSFWRFMRQESIPGVQDEWRTDVSASRAGPGATVDEEPSE